jgi:hypothetical protein
MHRVRIPRAAWPLALAALFPLSGCVIAGDQPEEVPIDQRAWAKCGLPLYTELGDPTGASVDRGESVVENLGEGRYLVTGTATVREDGSGQRQEYRYTCTVEEDAADERGVRVTDLAVEPVD